MSMKAVIIRIHSLLLLDFIVRCDKPSFRGRPAEGGGGNRASNEAGKRDDREHVRDHLDELRGNRVRALELDLERFRSSEKQTRQTSPYWIPLTKDDRGERNEATPRRHAVSELMLV